jgi:hypothetical protein
MSVGIALIGEIERVSAKRERWRGYARDSGSAASYAPAIMIMTAEIDEAKAALVSDDAARAIAALENLRAYGDDD